MDTLLTVAVTLPSVVKATLLHSLSLSSTSSKWDMKTALLVTFLRSSFDSPVKKSITDLQKAWGKKIPIKGNMWCSRATIKAPPEDDARQKLVHVVEELKITGNETYTVPDSVDITGEWHGLRAGAKSDTLEPKDLSEEAKYEKLMAETTSEAVVLYFHGGAFFIMDPSSHRGITGRLAPQIGGRVFSVRYRLAPQNPFPAALLDAFIAYLALLHPPPGSMHKAVPASKIILAGDSAGGNLVLALTQLLLQLHRKAQKEQGAEGGAEAVPVVRFHGEMVPVPLPAGLSPFSPWTDLSRSLPSLVENTQYDYLPPPDELSQPKPGSKKSLTQMLKERHPFPKDEAWPANPVRSDLYVDGSALLHPLASPLATRTVDWTGAPPTLFVVGQELMHDEMSLVAKKMGAGAGVKVRWEQWEAMPHVFCLILGELHPATIGRAAFERWGAWARQVLSLSSTQVKEGGDGDVLTGAVEVAAKTFAVRELPGGLDGLTSVSEERAWELMRAAQERLAAADPLTRGAETQQGGRGGAEVPVP
ncbi:Alpha/Beta hydrolase protein [Phyllosticta citrichinensis]|uniref:Alpha/Beta hydrolase protein n=1 Tax=Phyllosticta citrichinensis TaxID=1130410 RepID=A0ABR1XJ59_9PEZI